MSWPTRTEEKPEKETSQSSWGIVFRCARMFGSRAASNWPTSKLL